MPRPRKAQTEEVGGVWGLGIGSAGQVSISEEQTRKRLIQYWSEHPNNFIFGEDYKEREIVTGMGIFSRKLIWTADEDDESAPLKPFLDEEYVRRSITILHEEEEVITDKARQMYMTTLFLAYIMWNCMFKFYRRWIWTKQKEEESVGQLNAKVVQVHSRLPQWVREARPLEGTQTELIFSKTNSTIIAGNEAVARGAARGGTATGFGLDEGAFIPMFKEAWAAAAPMARKLFALTTPNIGTPSARTYLEMLERGQKQVVGSEDLSLKPVATADLPRLEGYNVRRTSKGIVVIEVDLEADPKKRSAAFKARLRRRQPNEREFRREYLRDWTIAAGESYYPEFGNNGGVEKYVLPAVVHGHLDLPIFRAWDFGIRSPSCVWFQVDTTERVWVLRELRGRNINIYAFADLVQYLSGEVEFTDLPPETEDTVRLWADKLAATDGMPEVPFFSWKGLPPVFHDFGGPEATFRDSRHKDTEENTDAEVLEGRGITLSVSSTQWAARSNVMRKALRVREDGFPGIIFDPSCKELIEAFSGALCFAAPSPANPDPDAPAKNGIHDHLHDALSYGLVQVIGLGENSTKDGRSWLSKRLPPPPPQALFHEGRTGGYGLRQASRPRLGKLWR